MEDKSLSSLESRIKFFILKMKIKNELNEIAMNFRLSEIRKKLGKLASIDPYGEEDWDN
jgi:hypothetical protein